MENKITASINVVYVQFCDLIVPVLFTDKLRLFFSVKEDSRIVIPPHGIADRRRVALLNLVTTESPVPFNIKP